MSRAAVGGTRCLPHSSFNSVGPERMDENSTPSSVLVLSQGLGFTMYTSVFQEVVMPQSSLQWKVLSGFGERSCDTMSLRPGHRLHRSTQFLFQTDVEEASATLVVGLAAS